MAGPAAQGRRVRGGLAGVTVEKRMDDATFVHGHSTLTTDLLHKVAATPGMITLRRAMYLYWLVVRRQRRRRRRSRSARGRAVRRSRSPRDVPTPTTVWCMRSTPSAATPATSRCTSSARRTAPTSSRTSTATSPRPGSPTGCVTHAMSSAEAVGEVSAAVDGVRMIYIDGEHSYDAVKEELELYAPLLSPGGLLDLRRLLDALPRGRRRDPRAPRRRRRPVRHPVQDDNFLVVRRRL